MRNSDCRGCSHYEQAGKYAIEKMKKSGFKDFIALINPEVDKIVDNALAFVENGNIEKGEEILAGLIKEYPDLYIVQYGMGTVLAMKGKYAESIVHFNKCLEIFPYFAEAWFNKGNSHKHLLDVGGALKSFQKVTEFGDQKEHFVKTAHEVLCDLEASIFRDTGLSLELYIQSMEEFDRAFSHMRNRNYVKAITMFHNVLNFNKNHTQSYGNLGLCYAFLGKRREALSAFNRALEIDPSYRPAIDNREILLSLKEGEIMPDNQVEVVDYYRKAIESESKN
jgi:tetratricopeptide (TPR) repeat protein